MWDNLFSVAKTALALAMIVAASLALVVILRTVLAIAGSEPPAPKPQPVCTTMKDLLNAPLRPAR